MIPSLVLQETACTVFSTFTATNDDTVHKYWERLDDIPDIVSSHDTLPDSIKCVKFMDDATLQEAVDLNSQLTTSDQNLVLLKQHSLLQNQLETIKHISDQREMTLNDNKTSLFVVNFSENRQFQPLLQIPGCQNYLNVISETKPLGYWFTENMKTHKHVQYILGIAYKRMWAIRKLQKASISPKDIIHFFNMKIRSVLETNCPVFHPMLTQEQSDDI